MKVEIKISRMSETGAVGLWEQLLAPAMQDFRSRAMGRQREQYAKLIAEGTPVTHRWLLETYGQDWTSERHLPESVNELMVLAPGEKEIPDRDKFLWDASGSYYLFQDGKRVRNEAWLNQKLLLNPDYEKIFAERATEATERQFRGFIIKQSQKTYGVLGTRGAEVSGTVDDNDCWQAYLTFNLSDGARFDMKCKLTYHYDGSVYQTPTTFHNVFTATGIEVKCPSEAKVKELLAPPSRKYDPTIRHNAAVKAWQTRRAQAVKA